MENTPQAFDWPQSRDKRNALQSPDPDRYFCYQFEDILEAVDIDRSTYTRIQTTNIAYIIVNKTRKLHDEIKTWNSVNPIQKIGSILKLIFAQPTPSFKKQANSQWRKRYTTN